MTNPSSRVRAGSPITISRPRPLRGEAKLRAALSAFAVDPSGRTALDVGAAAGGFTRVLLGAGARRVYAVDVGHGQLLGSLRQDSRVVHLERTNLAGLDEDRVPDVVDLVTIDVSYLALSSAAPQLERIRLAPDVEAIAPVKPQFELGLASPPEDRAVLEAALRRAVRGFAETGWDVEATMESPVRGSHGAVEFLLHAVRRR